MLPSLAGWLAHTLGGTSASDAACSVSALRAYSVLWAAVAYLVADLLALRLSIWAVKR